MHSFATYGEAPGSARLLRQTWDDHCALARHEGARLGVLYADSIRSCVLHVGYRLRSGEPTAVPAGVLSVLTALGSVYFALIPDSPQPVVTSLHIALGIWLTGLIFLRWPRWQPPWTWAVSSGVLGTAMIHAIVVALYTGELDPITFTGAVVMIASCVDGMAFGITGRLDQRRRSLTVGALGGFIMAMSVAGWSGSPDRAFAVACLIAAVPACFAANSLLRIRSQQPGDL